MPPSWNTRLDHARLSMQLVLHMHLRPSWLARKRGNEYAPHGAAARSWLCLRPDNRRRIMTRSWTHSATTLSPGQLLGELELALQLCIPETSAILKKTWNRQWQAHWFKHVHLLQQALFLDYLCACAYGWPARCLWTTGNYHLYFLHRSNKGYLERGSGKHAYWCLREPCWNGGPQAWTRATDVIFLPWPLRRVESYPCCRATHRQHGHELFSLVCMPCRRSWVADNAFYPCPNLAMCRHLSSTFREHHSPTLSKFPSMPPKHPSFTTVPSNTTRIGWSVPT